MLFADSLTLFVVTIIIAILMIIDPPAGLAWTLASLFFTAGHEG